MFLDKEDDKYSKMSQTTHRRKLLSIGIISIILIFLTYITVLVYVNIPKENKDTVQNTDIKGEKEIGTWRYGGGIENLSRRLHNNVWGLTDEEKRSGIVKSYIYYKYNGNFGWEWNRPNPLLGNDVYIPPIYPGVVIGASGPYSSTSQYFPIKLKDINSLTSEVEYNYTKSPIGGYNLAYDIWFVDGNNNKAEVMIWIYGKLGKPDKYVADGIDEYGYYYRPPSPGFDWDYHAFVLKDQASTSLNHKVNIKNLLDTLVKSKKLDTNWNMFGIELGSEISTGSGRIEISKFLINMNGNDV